MNLVVNGEATEVADVRTVAQLLKVVNPSGVRVAVMVNDAIVKAEDREPFVLREGDRVEVLTFAGGG